MEKINENISMNLKLIRKTKGLTLEELSRISSVSKSMLGEIERGSTNPTINILWKIAEGLKIPLTKLIEEKNNEFLIVKKDEKKLINKDSAFNIFSIFPYYDLHNLEMLKIVIAPLSKLSNPGHMNGVDEYLYVIEGDIKLIMGKTEIALNQGDAIRFKGEKSHEIINSTKKTISLLNVLVYR